MTRQHGHPLMALMLTASATAFAPPPAAPNRDAAMISLTSLASPRGDSLSPSFRLVVPTPHRCSAEARRRETGVMFARRQAGSRKMETMDPNDPQYKAAMERQRDVTAAMTLLQTWDEEQTEFVEQHADPNAPLGDWRGLRRQLNAEERQEMRNACKILAEEGAYTLLGLNGDKEDETRKALEQWVAGLELPLPADVPYMCDTWGFEYAHYDEMPGELSNDFKQGPVHLAYNSRAGADPATGSDANAPAAAHIMVYPASDRGVVFTPILEGFFTQYGDLPLDLFDLDMDDKPASSSSEQAQVPSKDLAMQQHAALGNPMAAMQLQKRREEEERERKQQD